MTNIRINAELINDWESFHQLFYETFGFPEFYGRNIDAWIDCMTYLDDWKSGMTKVWIEKDEVLNIEMENLEKFQKQCYDIFLILLVCVEMVNLRNVERNKNTRLLITEKLEGSNI